MRPDKSSATGNENASRSSSWFRFDDGISVLVHFFVSFVVHLTVRCSLCGLVSELFFFRFGVEEKNLGGKRRALVERMKKKKNKKKPNDQFRCFHLLWVESHVSLITSRFARVFVLFYFKRRNSQSTVR